MPYPTCDKCGDLITDLGAQDGAGGTYHNHCLIKRLKAELRDLHAKFGARDAISPLLVLALDIPCRDQCASFRLAGVHNGGPIYKDCDCGVVDLQRGLAALRGPL